MVRRPRPFRRGSHNGVSKTCPSIVSIRPPGHVPVYVDLTRDDLEIPVVRAVVPGLELTADFDVFSRPSVRLFRRYLEGK